MPSAALRTRLGGNALPKKSSNMARRSRPTNTNSWSLFRMAFWDVSSIFRQLKSNQESNRSVWFPQGRARTVRSEQRDAPGRSVFICNLRLPPFAVASWASQEPNAESRLVISVSLRESTRVGQVALDVAGPLESAEESATPTARCGAHHGPTQSGLCARLRRQPSG